MKKQLKNYIMIVCFLLFIFGFAVASFISEDREFSETRTAISSKPLNFHGKNSKKASSHRISKAICPIRYS